jgi:hypothetical protein
MTMDDRHRVPPAVVLLLAAPLVALAAWIALGGAKRSFGPAAPPAHSVPDGVAGLPRPAGLGAPEADLPPDRFWERVDGAADGLIAAGCRRMVVWRTAAPPAEIELLVFAAADGAAAFLGRDAGPERTPGGLGDEASVAPESIFFRRGRQYVRIIAAPAPAPAADPANPASLLDLARNVDSAIVANGMEGFR